MDEVWKPVKGYEGLYEVSNQGRVKSLNWRNKGVPGLLGQRIKSTGYYQVLLSKGGISKYAQVHRLVAQAFIPNPESNATVNHIDENKLNNNVQNLEWCSLRDNIRKYCENHKLDFDKQIVRSRKNGKHTFPVLQMTKTGEIINQWSCVAKVHRELNYHYWSISQCCDGKRKTAYGFKWQYAV